MTTVVKTIVDVILLPHWCMYWLPIVWNSGLRGLIGLENELFGFCAPIVTIFYPIQICWLKLFSTHVTLFSPFNGLK